MGVTGTCCVPGPVRLGLGAIESGSVLRGLAAFLDCPPPMDSPEDRVWAVIIRLSSERRTFRVSPIGVASGRAHRRLLNLSAGVALEAFHLRYRMVFAPGSR